VSKAEGRRGEDRFAYSFVQPKFFRLVDRLVPSEDENVVEQINLEIGRLALGPASTFELTLVDELSVLVVEPEFLEGEKRR
jgi:hypothetical protein